MLTGLWSTLVLDGLTGTVQIQWDAAAEIANFTLSLGQTNHAVLECFH